MAQAPVRIAHPLQPLSIDELGEAVAILRAQSPAGDWDDRRYRFVEVALREPAKAEYLAAEECDGLVVPGVGAFAACMAGLREVRGPEIIGRRLYADAGR